MRVRTLIHFVCESFLMFAVRIVSVCVCFAFLFGFRFVEKARYLFDYKPPHPVFPVLIENSLLSPAGKTLGGEV